MRWTKKIGAIEGWALLSIEDLISLPRPRSAAQRWQVSWLAGRRLAADLPGFPVVETWRTGSPLTVAGSAAASSVAALTAFPFDPRREPSAQSLAVRGGRASCPSTISRIGRSPGDASRRAEPTPKNSWNQGGSPSVPGLEPGYPGGGIRDYLAGRRSWMHGSSPCITAPAGRTRRPRFNQRAALIAATSTAL